MRRFLLMTLRARTFPANLLIGQNCRQASDQLLVLVAVAVAVLFAAFAEDEFLPRSAGRS